jgi:hypothetical protein
MIHSSDDKNRFVMCMECKHAVWPQASLGECHHPEIMDALTMEARNPNGACGPQGKLYEAKKDE